MSKSGMILALLALAACTEPYTSEPAAAPPETQRPALIPGASVSVVMSNLNSPRGLAWGNDGALYVAEAGTITVTGACFPFQEGAAVNTKCYSGTGSISRLSNGEQHRVVSRLPSSFIVQTGFATGPNDISFAGGSAYVPIGWGTDPATRAMMGSGGAHSGTLLKVEPNGHWNVVADIAAFEASNNPAGGPLDSNPYGVLAEADGRFVVDAGGNSLLKVALNGSISVVATFPTTPAPAPFNQSDAVPTKIKRGPHGALFVSTLSGVPFVDGSAVIYRVVPGQPPQVYAGGFKTITDFAFAPDGSLYVLQFASAPVFFGGPGALIRVAPGGTRTTISTDLFQPTGVTVGPNGAIYVSNKGTLTGAGEVLRIVLAP